MAPAAAINEPFLLSSYSATQRTSKSGLKIKNQRRQAGVYASYQKPSNNSDGFVSVAAQSDGVHVLDVCCFSWGLSSAVHLRYFFQVSTLHPIISHTLGPATTFACAPLTQHRPSKNTHTTYVVITSSSDVEAEHLGKTIWKWTENLSSSPSADRSSSSKSPHETTVVSYPIHVLHPEGYSVTTRE